MNGDLQNGEVVEFFGGAIMKNLQIEFIEADREAYDSECDWLAMFEEAKECGESYERG